ncbi:hypothetical protein Mame01_10180 [Microbispora amethystogenes]|nr:hypothetical protein Mame01_10180 [Microbispora amethystogenes]
MRAHSATPSPPPIANLPWTPAYHPAYAATGSSPDRASTARRRQGTRRTASTSTASRISGSAIVRVRAAPARSRPAAAAARADGTGRRTSRAVAATTSRTNSESDRTACSRRRNDASNSTGAEAATAAQPGAPLPRSAA